MVTMAFDVRDVPGGPFSRWSVNGPSTLRSAPGANVRVTTTGAPVDRSNRSGPNTCVVAAADAVAIAELDGRSLGDVAALVQASTAKGTAMPAANDPNLMRGLRAS